MTSTGSAGFAAVSPSFGAALGRPGAGFSAGKGIGAGFWSAASSRSSGPASGRPLANQSAKRCSRCSALRIGRAESPGGLPSKATETFFALPDRLTSSSRNCVVRFGNGRRRIASSWPALWSTVSPVPATRRSTRSGGRTASWTRCVFTVWPEVRRTTRSAVSQEGCSTADRTRNRTFLGCSSAGTGIGRPGAMAPGLSRPSTASRFSSYSSERLAPPGPAPRRAV